MRSCRSLLFTTLLLMFPFTAMAEKVPERDSLPSEKTQLIYETLLPSKETVPAPAERGDDASAQTTVSRSNDIGMTAEKVSDILRERNITLQGIPGQWEFLYEGMQIFLLADPDHNRIRIMTPLTRLDLLRRDSDFNEVKLLQDLLKANYLVTGDVRFCLNNHVIWLAFLHPLDSLTRRDLLKGLEGLVEVAQKTGEESD